MKRLLLAWVTAAVLGGMNAMADGSLLPVADGKAWTQRNPPNSTNLLHVDDTSATATVAVFTGNFGGSGVALFEFDISSLAQSADPYHFQFSLASAIPAFNDLSIYGKQGNGSIEFNDWRIPPGGEIVTPANSPLVIPNTSSTSLAALDLIETVGSAVPIDEGGTFQTSSLQFNNYLSNAILQNWNHLTVVLSSPNDFSFLQVAMLEHPTYQAAQIVSVPEPKTLTFLGIGLIALMAGLLRRRA
jgi:hypothetical protein